MPELKNFVAVDWRSDRDKCYFFFKDYKQYSRFDNGYNQTDSGYPKHYTSTNWGSVYKHLNNLRFGFHTSNIISGTGIELDVDILWLFFYEGNTPMFCEYDQDGDYSRGIHTVDGSIWEPLLPYFDKIIAGTWWERPGIITHTRRYILKFLLNDGRGLTLDFNKKNIKPHFINEESWPGLAPYKNRIITAVQMHSTFDSSYYYIFLSNNEFLKYNIDKNKLASGPTPFNDEHWPGIFG